MIGTSTEFLEGNILPDNKPRQYKVMAVTKKYNRKLLFDICILKAFLLRKIVFTICLSKCKDGTRHDCFSCC